MIYLGLVTSAVLSDWRKSKCFRYCFGVPVVCLRSVLFYFVADWFNIIQRVETLRKKYTDLSFLLLFLCYLGLLSSLVSLVEMVLL